jgi:2-methylisocitrate lyase-like PEP mutase family enzyme
MKDFEQQIPKSVVVSGAGGTDLRAAFDARCQAFRTLHEEGCFVMPNPWDVGSARYLRHLGFPALATTSAGFAFSQGCLRFKTLPDLALDVVESTVARLPVSEYAAGYQAMRDAMGKGKAKA